MGVKIKFFTVFCALFFSTNIFAQGEADNWYFGENAGLNFSTRAPVTIIDYPHFFTPNGDGINDTWAIIGQEGIPISQIYIFDRFGKLLAQLDPDGAGWDCMYNGNQMPGSDYWFKIIYIEGVNSTQKEFNSHFSLKR